MKTQKNYKKKFGKKAFLADWITDFYAILGLAAVILIFVFTFRHTTAERTRTIQELTDTTYANHAIQVYLNLPIKVGTKDITLSELIAIYDHNAEELQEEIEDTELEDQSHDPNQIIIGPETDVRDAIIKITRDYVKDTFPEDTCYLFLIQGNNIAYTTRGSECGFSLPFSPNALFNMLEETAPELFITRIAPVDPRDDPITIYAIYDIHSFIRTYAPEGSIREVMLESQA